MRKEDIVEKFLEQGFLLSPKMLDTLTDDCIENIFSISKTANNIVIQEIKKPKHILKSTNVKEQEKLSPKNFIEYNKTKYDTIKIILLQKTKPISIDKCKQNTDATIIGFVIDRTQQGYVIEDTTKKIEIRTSENLQLNSVLGFSGKLKENMFFVEKTTFPDIPLDNEIKTTNLTICFSEKHSTKNADILITLEGKENENTLVLQTPGKGKLNDIKIISYKPEIPLKKEECMKFLKYRFIPETKPNTNFIIKEVPDIFWIVQDEEWIENYKGVTIISTKDMLFDLGNRKKI